MLLDVRFEGEIEVLERHTSTAGRPYFEATLVSDDGQTLHIFEGQLKEVPDAQLEVGRRYRVTFKPFVNNRWIECKITSVEPAPQP